MDWEPRLRIRVLDDELYASGIRAVLARDGEMPVVAELLNHLLGIRFAWTPDKEQRMRLTVSHDVTRLIVTWQGSQAGPSQTVQLPPEPCDLLRIRSASASNDGDFLPFELTLRLLRIFDSDQELAEAMVDLEDGLFLLPHILLLDNQVAGTPYVYKRRQSFMDIINRNTRHREEDLQMYFTQYEFDQKERKAVDPFVVFHEKKSPLDALTGQFVKRFARSVVERQRRLPPIYRSLIRNGEFYAYARERRPVVIRGVDGSATAEAAFQLHRLSDVPKRFGAPTIVGCADRSLTPERIRRNEEDAKGGSIYFEDTQDAPKWLCSEAEQIGRAASTLPGERDYARALFGVRGTGGNCGIARLSEASELRLPTLQQADIDDAADQIRQTFAVLKERNTGHTRKPVAEKTAEARGDSTFGIVGSSAPIATVRDLIRKVAATNTRVLIRGESGTGKELIARAVHYASARSNEPFTALNCAALPSELVESELFGHERGAFTGATTAKAGRFEFARAGTIFLDEIGVLSASVQAKLLRVIQEGEFERLGSNRTIKTTARVIAATNVDLEAAVASGAFREDLFYRLNVFPVIVPPLRSRRGDIPALVSHFIQKVASNHRVSSDRNVSDDALEALTAHDWPGNVRELENTIERAMIMMGNRLTLERHDLLAAFNERAPSSPIDQLSQKRNSQLTLSDGAVSELLAHRNSFEFDVEHLERELVNIMVKAVASADNEITKTVVANYFHERGHRERRPDDDETKSPQAHAAELEGNDHLYSAVIEAATQTHGNFRLLQESIDLAGHDPRPLALGILKGLTYDRGKQVSRPYLPSVKTLDSKSVNLFSSQGSTHQSQIDKAVKGLGGKEATAAGWLNSSRDCAIIYAAANICTSGKLGINAFTFVPPPQVPSCCNDCLTRSLCHALGEPNDRDQQDLRAFQGPLIRNAAKWLQPE